MHSVDNPEETVVTQGIRSKCINKLEQDYKYSNRTKTS